MARCIDDHEPRLEETKRVSRVLRTIRLVSAHPRTWTRARLAERFELSERMIDKDLQLLRHGLCFDLQHVQSGYYFATAPVVQPIELSVPEALALALAAQQARDTGAADATIMASALAQLEQALPAGIIPYLRRAATAGVDQAFGPMRDRGTTLAMLERAMVEKRTLAITYRTASRDGAVTERTVAPYYLQPYERSWIAIAHDSRRDAVLMFKVDRIQDCHMLAETYTIPDDFSPASYLGETWGVLRGESGPAEDVELRFSAEPGRWVCDDRWHHSQITEPLPSGDLLMRFHCGVSHELVRWVLSFGSGVYVEKPEGLRRAVTMEAQSLITLNRDAASAAFDE